MWTLKELSEMP